MPRRRFPRKLGPLVHHVASRTIASRVFIVFLALCVVGFVVGRRSLPDPTALPYQELLENLSIYSWRDSPSDTVAHFVVELSTGRHVFQRYDIDRRRFEPPGEGHEYRRAISGSHYAPLALRGRSPNGFWLTLADSTGSPVMPGQFAELYRRTLDYVKPVSTTTNVVGILSGYSVGYRIATWSVSLSNPAVQARVLETPGVGRFIAHEAWRRVVLEPAVIANQGEPRGFAAAYEAQRLYGNFFKLACRDSDGFIPHEAERLAQAGHGDAARMMLDFAHAVARAVPDSCDLTSSDFRAVEDWAAYLDREGHWAKDLIPPPGQERAQYLGVLAWYGLSPAESARRMWIGPRMLVREANTEGFVADDLAATEAACPFLWRARLFDYDDAGMSAWTAQWTADRPEFAPLVSMTRRIAHRLHPSHSTPQGP